MKTTHYLQPVAWQWCGLLAASGLAFLAAKPAHAQCLPPEDVLSQPTLNSIQVRTITDTFRCNRVYDSGPIFPTADPCISAEWFAVSTGGSGLRIAFEYDFGDSCHEVILARSDLSVEISQPFLDAHLNGFIISSDERLPSGEGVIWSLYAEGTQPAPLLSFIGTVSFVENTGYRADITFMGRPADVKSLIALLNDSTLSPQKKRPLLATLKAVDASFTERDCEVGIRQLQAFQNKVRAQIRRQDAVLADALIAAAQAIIDSGCNEGP